MRHSFLVAFFLLPLAGHATVGGPDRVEVLGYEPTDGKLYYLVHRGGEIAEPPWLRFLALQSAKPHQARRVRSWYVGPTQDDIEAAFPGRLEKLKARLKPVPPADRLGATVRVQHRDLRVCADAPYQPRSGEEARAIVEAFRRDGHDIDHPVCELHSVGVEWAGYAGQTHVESWGSPSLLSVYRLPDSRFALAIVRHVGKHFESGYTDDVPVLMRRAEKVARPAAPSDARCARWAASDHGVTSPAVVRPGAWVPSLGATHVDRRWRQSESRAFSVGHVRHAVTVAQRGDHASVAVGRAARGGGMCVVAVLEDAFGGKGVDLVLLDVAEHGGQVVLLLRHDRLFGDGKPERVWSALHLDGRRVDWLARGEWPETTRPTVVWASGKPKLRLVTRR